MNPKKFSENYDVALRRMDYAREFLFREDKQAAIDIYQSVVLDWPDFAPAWFELGRLLDDAQYYHKYLELDPEDTFNAHACLAVVGQDVVPEKSPEAYVEALFDDYAHHFEDALINRLHYQAPFKLAEMLGDAPKGAVLDLGCGTGLMGEELKGGAAHLVGVDISSAMIAEAKAKKIYNELFTAEIVSWFCTNVQMFDHIIAADVFAYFGALEEAFVHIASHLNVGGKLAFTVEKSGTGQDWYLRETLRYAHSEAYIRAALDQAGLYATSFEEAPLRNDRGNPIDGYYVVAELKP